MLLMKRSWVPTFFPGVYPIPGMNVLAPDGDPRLGNSRPGSRKPRTSGSKSNLGGRGEARAGCTAPASHAPRTPGPRARGRRERAQGGASGARGAEGRRGAWPTAPGPAAAAAGSWEARSPERGAQSGGGGGGGSGDGGGCAAAAAVAAARAGAAAAAAGPGPRGGAGEPAHGVLEQLQPAVSPGPGARASRVGGGEAGGRGSPAGAQLGAGRRRRGGHALWAPVKLGGRLSQEGSGRPAEAARGPPPHLGFSPPPSPQCPQRPCLRRAGAGEHPCAPGVGRPFWGGGRDDLFSAVRVSRGSVSDSCLEKWGPEPGQGVRLRPPRTPGGGAAGWCGSGRPGELGLGPLSVGGPPGRRGARMGPWGRGEREGSGGMAGHTRARAHTRAGMACGSGCERACAAVRVRVCLGV